MNVGEMGLKQKTAERVVYGYVECGGEIKYNRERLTMGVSKVRLKKKTTESCFRPFVPVRWFSPRVPVRFSLPLVTVKLTIEVSKLG